MKHILTIGISLLVSLSAYSQAIVKGSVRNQDNEPIPYCSVYIKNKPQAGSITNADGRYYLKTDIKPDSIIFSHIQYETKIGGIEISKTNTILKQKVNQISEVCIKALSAKGIMMAFYKRFKENHFIEPARYKAFTRIVSTMKDELYLMEEYYLDLYQKKSHNTSFNIIKCRAKPFSKYGRKIFKDYRLIPLSKMRSDNIFKYREDILVKGKLKNYNLKLKGYTNINQREAYIIEFAHKENTRDKGRLIIDRESFGLASAKFDNKEITFFVKNKQWYINSVITESTWMTGEYKKRISIYELQDKAIKLEEKNLIMVEKIKSFIGDYDDAFWQGFTHIPLDSVYLKQMEN
ncbi:carboxypeptidase-like regulatory domain-containing protein [Ancylomarina sp. YFZ004]